MTAAMIHCVCTQCFRAYVAIGPQRTCPKTYQGCGGKVIDLPEPLPNDERHIVNKWFLRDEFNPVVLEKGK